MAFNPNIPAQGNNARSDLAAMKENFLRLRDNEAGSSEPSNLAAGILWADSSGTEVSLKLRNKANTAWLAIDTTPIGSVTMYVSSTAPTNWLVMNGSSIGDGSSGATARANADTQTLFELLWNQTTNSDLPIQDSSGNNTTRGASATADFNAHKRMPLPDMRGRAPIGLGQGSGLTNRAMAAKGGEETHPLSTGEMPQHTHTESGHAHQQRAMIMESATTPTDLIHATGGSSGSGAAISSLLSDNILDGPLIPTGTAALTTKTASVSLSNAGSSQAHNNMMPFTTLNFIIKYKMN